VPDTRAPSVSEIGNTRQPVSNLPSEKLKALFDTRFHLDTAPLDLCLPSMLESYYQVLENRNLRSSNMPSRETIERFVARVEDNAHVEAIREFYTEEASMRENNTSPRVGRDALIKHEREVLSRANSVQSTCVRPVLVDGDIVVVRWIFQFEWKDGSTTRMEELAYQRWEGERIAEEQFFYDPAQRIPRGHS
jgi:hypothetical protein